MSATKVVSNQGGFYANTPQIIMQDTAEQTRAEAEKDAQIRKEVMESDDRLFDGVKKLF